MCITGLQLRLAITTVIGRKSRSILRLQYNVWYYMLSKDEKFINRRRKALPPRLRRGHPQRQASLRLHRRRYPREANIDHISPSGHTLEKNMVSPHGATRTPHAAAVPADEATFASSAARGWTRISTFFADGTNPKARNSTTGHHTAIEKEGGGEKNFSSCSPPDLRLSPTTPARYYLGWYIDLQPDVPVSAFMSTDAQHLYMNAARMEEFTVKGVNLGVGIPGEWATDYANQQGDYSAGLPRCRR